ncbi:hypothetical protein PLICRDRAFT_180885 [Plicaturopsis crispa FD-325 SS-3]|uniref:Uncharacterized protein n=2 Tax=Plicaturopsis crispa FD-325 SS-3 TaxID=944288 RepID=A0A0C9T499_PLICR|nr:hypothetical protein PLICRDRAFT_180885 [Plicaturopsis crispa FD-325 SS-3]
MNVYAYYRWVRSSSTYPSCEELKDRFWKDVGIDKEGDHPDGFEVVPSAAWIENEKAIAAVMFADYLEENRERIEKEKMALLREEEKEKVKASTSRSSRGRKSKSSGLTIRIPPLQAVQASFATLDTSASTSAAPNSAADLLSIATLDAEASDCDTDMDAEGEDEVDGEDELEEADEADEVDGSI